MFTTHGQSAHECILQGGEIAFIDSTSSLDHYNLSMFTISTSYSGGGLTLRIIKYLMKKLTHLEALLLV